MYSVLFQNPSHSVLYCSRIQPNIFSIVPESSPMYSVLFQNPAQYFLYCSRIQPNVFCIVPESRPMKRWLTI
jgi:hypothetical protein